MMSTEKVRTFSLNSNSGGGGGGGGSSSTNNSAGIGAVASGGGAGVIMMVSESGVHETTTTTMAGNEVTLPGMDLMSVMNLSQMSTDSRNFNQSSHPPPPAAAAAGQQMCRFPKLEECAHFHYERVQLGAIVVRVVDERSEANLLSSSSLDSTRVSTSSAIGLGGYPNGFSFILRVSARRSEPFLIKRSFENLKMLDALLHQCVYDRKVSGLSDLQTIDAHLGGSRQSMGDHHGVDGDLDDVEDSVFSAGNGGAGGLSSDPHSEDRLTKIVANYFNQFSAIASDAMTCGPVLTWLQLDNKGRRLPVADVHTMTTINTPAVGAAYGVRKYVAQACDEISIEVGDMISVIDMPSPAESVWWRGKKSLLQKNHYEVGFFPQSCVATIGEKIPRHMPLPAPLVGSLALSPTKPVLRKHGKLIAFFRSFILARPSRRRLKQSGIYKERVFSCDLSEHLLNSRQDIPMVLRCCAEFIEQFGIVDGIYRLSGITSNIQRLRRAFDEERVPDLTQAEIKQDIHAVSSLLKMYFRELPNPLCTYQLYDRFVEAIQAPVEGDAKLREMKETVQKLPPPHYRTLKYLANHLHRIAKHAPNTGMTDRNLAIVWAPNLLRSPALESGGVAALRGVGVQAVVTEYLITHSDSIFDEDFVQLSGHESLQQESMTDSDSLISGEGSNREGYDSLAMLPSMLAAAVERPKSLNVSGGTKLISLEEAQSRHNRAENIDKEIAVNTPKCTSYIEVGGGPSSLPDKYHTVLPVPRHWQKRKTHSWKSLFMRGQRGATAAGAATNASHHTPLTAKDIKVIMNPSDVPVKLEKLTRKDSKLGRKDKIQSSEKDKSPMTKSVDVFDAKAVVSMDVCVRSNSVDSLRTAGHSRSVSHDSYFDLLQSPLRGIVNCPSRELSELGMNFDREEPEMRLFSESESLVSSPRIAKDNGANGGTSTNHSSRRVLRSRPEEFSNTGNSINPSPKKQPRLNIQSSAGMTDMAGWGPMSMDESMMCKRYKLEDQLSDIQFIDCNTPEHHQGVVNPTAYSSSSSLSASFNATTKFNTNAQVHAPPTIVIGVGKGKENAATGGNLKSPLNRFSYPQYLAMNPDQPRVQIRNSDPVKKDNDRFSFPGEAREGSNKRYGYQADDDDQSDSLVKSVMDHFNFNKIQSPKGLSADPSQQSLQTIVTPSSPSQSPRYSLLTGGGNDTSSENFSESGSVGNLLNPMLMGGNNMMETSVTSATKLIERQISDRGGHIKDQMVMSEDEMVDEHTRDTNNEGDVIHDLQLEKTFVDISALKRKFSLDLMADCPSSGRGDVDKAQKILTLSTPNTPNQTLNSGGGTTTSQSVTPSEFGYQHLNRLSNVCTPVTTPHSADFMIGHEVTPQLMGSLGGGGRSGPGSGGSPIKSTICITYNTKSPVTTPPRSCPVLKSTGLGTGDDYEVIEVDSKEARDSSLLETSFDENMVYEQVKFFRNAVSAINDLVEGNTPESGEVTPKATTTTTNIEATIASAQIVPEMSSSPISLTKEEEFLKQRLSKGSSITTSDVPMVTGGGGGDGPELDDSLEFDNNMSLYENVIVEKPPVFYENVEMRRSLIETRATAEEEQQIQKPEVFQSIKVEQYEDKTPRPKESFSASVKQLATKFETSPVDPQPPFDFSKSGAAALLRRDGSAVAIAGTRTEATDRNRMTAPASGPVMMVTKNGGSSPRAIARSLDENAFVREFGSVKILDKFPGEEQRELRDGENNQNSENINGTVTRRTGGSEYAKPKSLNPPKKLPSLMDGTAATVVAPVDACKVVGMTPSPTIRPKDDPLSKSSPYLPPKITPTTENRISLIQSNAKEAEVVNLSSKDEEDASGTQLGNCKLDRDRIERIKEERRLQLNEKFRSESFKGENDTIKFKSKSKTELRAADKAADGHSASTLDRPLRSKSKADVSGGVVLRDDSLGRQQKFVSNRSEEQLSWSAGTWAADRKSILIQDRNRRVSESGGKEATISESKEAAPNNWKLRNKFEKRSSGGVVNSLRERQEGAVETIIQRNMEQQRESCSPQFSIKDVAAMFESRSQN